MATLKTTDVKNVREDLGDFIYDITPQDTPFISEIGKSKVTNTYHETLTDELAAPDGDNAAVEGADAADSTLTGPERIGNWTQIFTKTAQVSGTLENVNSAGYKSTIAKQISKALSEIKRDMEVAAIGNRGSVNTGARKLAGAGAWLKTNSDHGAGGATAGFANGLVPDVVVGDLRPLTEDMFNDMAQKIWNEGGDPSIVFAPGSLKQAISKFSGNATKYQDANKTKTVYAGVDYYVSDFGTHQIIPHRFMPTTQVFFCDPKFWSIATLRTAKTELGKTGDSIKYQVLNEATLESRNEKASGKIADLIAG